MSAVTRRRLARAALAGAMLGALRARARAAAAGFRIFIVQWRGETEVEQGMRAYLQRAGLQVQFTVRDAAQDRARLPQILAEIRAARPDLVFTFATEATLGIAGTIDAPAGAFLTDIPIVFAAVGDPVAANLVRETAHAGRNVTGVIHLPPIAAQFEAMTLFRAPRRIGVLHNSAETYGRAAVAQLASLVAKAGKDMRLESCTGADGKPDAALIRPALQRIAAAGVDLLYLPSTSFFIPLAETITGAALQAGLPAFCANEELIRGGQGLAGLIAPPPEVGAFAGHKIEQILAAGQHAADIPIESLARFVLLINLPVSLRTKVYPPLGMLRYAEVIGQGRQD